MRSSRYHHELTNGVGKCSVPMWQMGMECFCDAPAYGKRPPCREYFNHGAGEWQRLDLKYNGYVPGLACEAHGGPAPTHFGDPCVHCGIPHDEVPVGPCSGLRNASRNVPGSQNGKELPNQGNSFPLGDSSCSGISSDAAQADENKFGPSDQLTKTPSADHDDCNLRGLAEPTPSDSSESTTGGAAPGHTTMEERGR